MRRSLKPCFFRMSKERRGGHFSAHSCAVEMKVVAFIESEVIHGENHADEDADGASGYGVE